MATAEHGNIANAVQVPYKVGISSQLPTQPLHALVHAKCIALARHAATAVAAVAD